MTILLLIGFSYYWLGNTVHEIVGTGFYLFLIVHNVLNRQWYNSLKKEKYSLNDLINIFSIALLFVSFTLLMITSILISKFQYNVIGVDGGFLSRRIHTSVSYWIIIIVSIHLGLRWQLLMSLPKRFFKISLPAQFNSWLLKFITVVIAIQGIRSSSTLGLGGKLFMRMSLDWWNFDDSVVIFFLHLMAVSGLYLSITYYLVKFIESKKNTEE